MKSFRLIIFKMSKCDNCNSTYILLCYIVFSPMLIEISSSILSIIGGIIIYYGLSRIPFHLIDKIYKTIFIINIPFFIILMIINILFIFFRVLDKINNERYLWCYYLSMFEMVISTIDLLLNLIYDSFIIKQIIGIVQTRKEWLFTKIILSLIPFILINILLMNVADNLLISLKINGSYRQYELAIEAENKVSNKKEENSNTEGSTDESSGNSSNNNNKIRMSTSMNNANNNVNNNININNNFKNLNNINEIDKNNVRIIINNNINNSNLNENNNEMNNNIINDIKASVMSTNRLIKNDNDMNENLGENEEVKY